MPPARSGSLTDPPAGVLPPPHQIFAEAKELLPGGVNSPVRAFASVGGNPIVFETAKGSKVVDVDGNSYVDYVGSWGPAICGHGAEEVNDALKAQIDKGTSFGAPCELENQLASLVGHHQTPRRSINLLCFSSGVRVQGGIQ